MRPIGPYPQLWRLRYNPDCLARVSDHRAVGRAQPALYPGLRHLGAAWPMGNSLVVVAYLKLAVDGALAYLILLSYYTPFRV